MTSLFEKIEAGAPTPSGPRGWIQWKGTNVCMDCTCACGESFHIDADFAYAVRCPYCRQVWGVSPHVRLVAVDESEAGNIEEAVINALTGEPA